jgi:hypothetical protein
MNAQAESHTRLHGRWLLIARLAWAAGFTVLTAMYALGFLAVREALSTVCQEEPCSLRQQIRRTDAGEQVLGFVGPPFGYGAPLRPDQVEALDRLGLRLDQYGWLAALQMGIPTLMSLLIAAGLFWRKSDDWMVLFASVMVATSPQEMPLAFTLTVRQPAWEWVYAPTSVVFLSCFLIFPLIFPTGRFVPRWTRWMVLFVIAGTVILPLFRNSIQEIPVAHDLVPVHIVIAFGTGVYAQLYRYFRVASPIERQQLKWVIVGLAGYISIALAVWLLLDPLLTSQAASMDPARALVLSAIPDTLFRAISLFVPVSIAISVLRYRLWDIDFIISRTLVYSVLSSTLALTYFASVVLLQAALRLLTGQGQNQLVTAASTLAIAALFLPLRRRVQDGIDRRFYRKKYDAAKTLAAFSATVRDETDLDKLTQSLVDVVQDSMQREGVSLWLKPAKDHGDSRLSARVGDRQ